MGRENENGPRVEKKCHWIKGAEGNGAEEKNKGPENELRRRERKLRGIREQQEARDTNVAWLKKAEVRKTVEDGCCGAEWETRGGPDTGRTRDSRWGFARNQSGGKDGLSAAKSDWVSRSQSARYSVVCGRVRLVDTNRSCVGSASEARSGARDRKSGADKDRSMREIRGRRGSGAEGQGKCRRGSEGGGRCE